MKNLFFLLLIILTFGAQAQERPVKRNTISGTIKDAKNGEELIGASVYAEEVKTGVATNTYGFFALSLPPGKYNLVISYLGYETQKMAVDITSSDQKLKIELQEEQKQLKEVVISTDKPDAKNVQENKMSVVKMDIKQVRKIPLLLGEVDVIKAVQLLPGIQAAGDGNTLFIVRGGNVDHNLVQLDEAVVYNPSHVVGFFSVFNGDAIKDFEIYKGGIPAQYGGRLASVLDVRMKDGNSKNYNVSGGIGILSSRLTIEGPIQKDKSSFMISGRRSYFDLAFPFFQQTKDAIAYFGDLNLKMNFTLGEKDKLFLSGYVGRDKMGSKNLFGIGWGNQTGTVRWNHVFDNKLFSNTSFILSRYNFSFDVNLANLNFTRSNSITDFTLKQDYNYYMTQRSTLKFGLSATYHIFEPGKIEPINSESIITADKLATKKALDYAIYASHKYNITSRLNVEYGARVSIFQNMGGKVFTYNGGKPNYFDPTFGKGQIMQSGIIDTTNYSSGHIYNTYIGFEPRLNVAYVINSEHSVKASYNRMYQYANLIQTTSASIGQEFWTPADKYIKPQIADQVALGYFRNFRENTIEASAEIYYKWMQNTVELIDNANVEFTEAVETQVTAGKGRAYGLELFLRKQRGKTTGWISYTLAKSERKADGVNGGEWYNFRYDRRHYLTLVLAQDLSDRVSVSANFIYATGDTYTPAISFYEIAGKTMVQYGNRNSARVPSYNRLDVSLTLGRKKIPGKVYKNESNWVFSIYNVYGQKNPYSITFSKNEDTGKMEAVKTYLFTFVPSVTYNFKF